MQRPTGLNPENIFDMILGLGEGMLLSLLSGVMLSLSFPNTEWWFLAYVALVPMLYAQHVSLPERYSSIAPAVTVTSFLLISFRKVQMGFSLVPETSNILASFILKTKSRTALAVFITVFFVTFFQRSFHKFTGYRYFLAETSLFWGGTEFFRDAFTGLGTSVALGYTQYLVIPILRVAAFIGVWGISALIAGTNAFVLTLIRWKRDAAPLKAQKYVFAALFAGIMLFCNLFYPLAAGKPEAYIPVAALSPGWNRSFESDRGLDVLFRLSREAASRGSKVLVWPEATFFFEPFTGEVGNRIKSLARELGVYIVVPYFYEYARFQDGSRQKMLYANEACIVSPDGEVIGWGAKDHPVTALGETSATRGRYHVTEVAGIEAGIMICYDLNFTDTARKLSSLGARILLVPSNDWLGLGHMQKMYASFRAVENQVALVKSDTSYCSSVVAPDGRIASEYTSGGIAEGFAAATVPVMSGKWRPLAGARLAGAFMLGCWLYIVVGVLLRRIISRRRDFDGGAKQVGGV